MKTNLFFLVLFVSFAWSCNKEKLELSKNQDLKMNSDTSSPILKAGGVWTGQVEEVSRSVAGFETTTKVTYFNGYAFYPGLNLDKVFIYNGSEWGVNTAGSTEQKVGAAFFNGRYYIAYKGKRSNQIFYKSSTDLRNWTSEVKLSNYGTSEGVSLVTFNNRLYFIFKSGTSEVIHFVSFGANEVVTPDKIISEPRTKFHPVAFVANNRLYVVYKGQKNKSHFYYTSMDSNENWATEHTFNGSESISSYSAGYYGGRMYLTGVDGDNSVTNTDNDLRFISRTFDDSNPQEVDITINGHTSGTNYYPLQKGGVSEIHIWQENGQTYGSVFYITTSYFLPGTWNYKSNYMVLKLL